MEKNMTKIIDRDEIEMFVNAVDDYLGGLAKNIFNVCKTFTHIKDFPVTIANALSLKLNIDNDQYEIINLVSTNKNQLETESETIRDFLVNYYSDKYYNKHAISPNEFILKRIEYSDKLKISMSCREFLDFLKRQESKNKKIICLVSKLNKDYSDVIERNYQNKTATVKVVFLD